MNPIPGQIRPSEEIRSESGDGSDGRIIITTHLISIHLISTMGFNFIRLSDSIGSDFRIRMWFRFSDPMNSTEFRQNSNRFLIGSDKIRLSDLITWIYLYVTL